MKYVFLLLGVICIFHSFMFSTDINEFTVGVLVCFGYTLLSLYLHYFKPKNINNGIGLY